MSLHKTWGILEEIMKTLSLYFVIASLAFAGASDIKLETIAPNLKATVNYLSSDIGERSWNDLKKLGRAADYIEDKFRSSGPVIQVA